MDDAVRALIGVARAFDRLGVSYIVVGSIASSLAGEPRTTHDVDFVASLDSTDVDALIEALGPGYYAERDTILNELRRGGMFNLIDLTSMIKVDVFVRGESEHAREEMRRRVAVALEIDGEVFGAYTASPEDVILAKLRWYREGREASALQWRDVLGVLKVQGVALDVGYLSRWAEGLGVDDLLSRALTEAGIADEPL